MKKIYISLVVITILVAFVSKMLIINNPSSNIYSACTYYQIVEASDSLPVYSLNVANEDYGDTLLSEKDNIIKKISGETILNHGEVNIMVVRTQNNYSQLLQSYTQNAIIKEIISGDEKLKGNEITVVSYYGVFPNDNNQFCFWGTRGRNIMIPDNDYLIFCEKVETSDYYSIPMYRILPTTFSCLNLNSDYSKIVDINNNYYKEYIGSEFFVNNKKTLDAVLEIKHEIIDSFYARK